jgi:geranylgeranyl pyrophosphate synthase
MTRATLRDLQAGDPILERELSGRLDEVEAYLEKAIRSDTDFVSQATSHLVSSGGKRIRPLLVLTCGYFGDPRDPRLIQGATAIEIIHVATLYHDDVMDEADVRHGVPSVNARWDNTVAILAGDFLFAKASDISSDLGGDITRLLARTITILCDGQIREVAETGRIDRSVESYMEVIRRKTAMLMSTSCRLGGMLSEAPPDAVDLLEDFGMALGMAFQLSDDIMDFASSERELHKTPGQDMREGVYTLPVLFALGESPRRGELAELLSKGPPSGERFDRAFDIVREEGVLRRAREEVTREIRRARTFAQGLAPGPARDALIQVAEFTGHRCDAAI